MLAGKRKGNQEVWWAIHNLIAHPLSEVAYWFGMQKVANWLHDETVPLHDTRFQGRG